jgi:anti-sigma-K factor RskA
MSDDLHTMAGLYALDALDDLEMRRFERHLDECESCRIEVQEFREAAQRMSGPSQERPPSGLKARVIEEVQRTPQVHLRTGTTGHRRGRFVVGVLGAAASVVLVATLAVALVSTRSDLSDARALSELLGDPRSSSVTYRGADGVVARLVGSPGRDRLVVLLGDLPAIDSDRAYAIWLIGADGPKPMALVRPDGSGQALAVIDAPVDQFQTFGLTDEPAGGSPAPTGPIIVSGAV